MKQRVSSIDIHYFLPGNADYSKLAPPKSYIDVRDFESPSHLASHLKYLMDHPKEYDSYLEWSKRYRVLNNSLVSSESLMFVNSSCHEQTKCMRSCESLAPTVSGKSTGIG